MKRCSICHATYPATFSHCPHDGSPLIEANEWTEGAVIRGKYRILGKLGQGGMATVYKAVHIGFDEVRALKMIHPELASDMSFVKRFGQEAALTRKLQHPNAVRVEDIDQADDGRPFMVMEFIEGESLKEVIQREAPLPAPRVCRIAKQVAGALDAAHLLGIVHRDIKPGNILLTRPSGGEREEVAKVLDFGIAKIKEAQAVGGATLTRTGTSVGTPAYMSPEQALGTTGAALDGRADLYSLGVVMYEMLTGELPIKAESEVQMLIGQVNTPPQPIATRRPELPEGIGAIVMQCLEKDPARRPPSGAALIAQIEAAETGMGVGAPPDEVPTVATPRPAGLEMPGVVPARRPSRWAWVALPAAAIAIAGSWYFGSRHKTVPRSPAAAPATVASQPSAQVVPAPNLPPEPPAPSEVRPATPSVRTPTSQHDQEEESDPADDLQGALNAAPIDKATKAQVQDVWRQANRLMKKGDFAGAAAQYQRLARLHPGWDLSGPPAGKRAAKHAGDLAAAITQYGIAIGLHPNVAINHYKLGATLGKFGDQDGDMREQQEALRLDPGLAMAHLELGEIHSRQADWSEAANEYREAIRLRPNLARAHFRLGGALERQGDTAGALEEYRRATELQPDNEEFQASYQRLRR